MDSAPSLISKIDKSKNVVDIVYCNANIDNISLYLILDTGSVKNIMSKSFLDKLNWKIEKLSNINITDINREKRRSLGTISNLLLSLLNTTISIDIEVNDT